VLVQGLAPHDLDGYLLQRDRWARGNLAVFTLPESPLRARELHPLQRLSYFVSLAAYLAPPMRLLLLATLGLVLWTGALPMKVSVLALAALWLPSVSLNLLAGSALARGYMRIGESAHYELLTMEIYSRALRCIVRPGRTAFEVTPKQGADAGGLRAVRKLHLVLLAAVVLASGTGLRLLDLAGVGPLPDMPGIAAIVVPALGLIELRRVLRTLLAVGRRQQRRQIYRFQGEAPVQCFSEDAHVGGHLVDASAAGVGLVLDAPLPVGARPAVLLELEDASGKGHEVAAQVEVRSCREAEGRFLVGATIEEIDPMARMWLMEWCYVVCSHERLRGHRPATPIELEPIVLPLPTPEPQAAAA
jgi:cellulose synthase (UDP-forming)